MTLVYASCVAIDGSGILLRGSSGAGKSDLALRLTDEGARLVADDQVELVREEDHVLASAPAKLAGMLEVRGLGIVRLPPLAKVPLLLVVDLGAADAIERMPEPTTTQLLGIGLVLVHLDPFAASATAKLRLAVRVAAGSIMREP